MSGMPLLVEEVSGCAAVAWHLHLSLEAAKRSGFGRELIALGACECTGGRLIWSGPAEAGGCWSERLVRCGFC